MIAFLTKYSGNYFLNTYSLKILYILIFWLDLNVCRFKGYNFTKDDLQSNTALTFHRIVEAFQMAYAQRYKLADPDYEQSVKKV